SGRVTGTASGVTSCNFPSAKVTRLTIFSLPVSSKLSAIGDPQ
ncbi:hypothetical protein AZ034_001870, partial [Pluralibacter gergoviae]